MFENDPLPYGLYGARLIDHLYYNGEATVSITYGGFLGTGKSSYDIKTMAEILGSHSGHEDNVPNFDAVKKALVFPPKDFVEYVLKMKKREKVICWDDGGLWLFALDWNDPFVKATCKYLNVMRTDFALMKINTPSPSMVAKKIKNFPEIVRFKITKSGGDMEHEGKPRLATAYRVWRSADLKKNGVKKLFVDDYDAMLPNSFYSWYDPIRKDYARLAKELMKKALDSLLKKEAKENSLDAEDFQEKLYKKAVPSPERVAEFEEVVSILEQEDRFGELKPLKD